MGRIQWWNIRKIISPVLDACNNSPHSTTKIQVLMNISKRAKKKSNYPKLKIGDNVRVPVVNKVKKRIYRQFQYENS